MFEVSARPGFLDRVKIANIHQRSKRREAIAAVVTLPLGYIRRRGGVQDKTSVNDGTVIIPFSSE